MTPAPLRKHRMTAERRSLESIRLVAVGATGSGSYALTTGPDDALWFTLNQADAIGRISTAGEAAIHPLPTPDAGPVGIAAIADAIWFVEIAAGQAGHIGPDGEVREIALPASSEPHGLTIGPDGALWVALERGAVARIAI
jgi:virginiamycin B lyase